MRLIIFNVGQGDCILLELPGQGWGLVDCHFAPEQAVPPVLAWLNRLGIKDLEFICLSHPDYDHFKGMMTVIHHVHNNGGTVKRFWIFGVMPVRDIHRGLRQAAREAKMTSDASPGHRPVITAEEVRYHSAREREFAAILRYIADRLKQDERESAKSEAKQDYRRRFSYRRLIGPAHVRTFDDVRLYCLAPTSAAVEDYESVLWSNPFSTSPSEERENNCVSVVLGLMFGETIIVLGGDAGKRQWKSVFRALEDVTEHFPTKADFLKTSHHGSRHGCDASVLLELSAEGMTVAISADFTTNLYGHPHTETLNHLAELAQKGLVKTVYCTNRSPQCVEFGDRDLHVDLSDLPLDQRHCYELFSSESATPTTANACFGTCEFEITKDHEVRLVSKDGPAQACWISRPTTS
ncbi:MAG: MBL fold metallo-hydrolase [Terriglobia bacterium]